MKLDRRSVTRRRVIWLGLALIGVTIFAAGTAIGWDKIIRRAEGVLTAVSVDRSHGEEKFPELPKNLSTHQRKILELARQEFLAQSPGAKFSEGATEPWCANFVSWVMHRAGSPLKKPAFGKLAYSGNIHATRVL